MAISGRHLQSEQSNDKTYQPIAPVAALPERHAGRQYPGHVFYGVRLSGLSLRGAKRRGALSAKREEVPLGCNLAAPD